MATIPSSTVLKPVGEKFGKERFIGLEIETSRSEYFFPKPKEGIHWDVCSWNLVAPAKKHIAKTLNPSGEYIAMVGKDGEDIEIATQPFSLNRLITDVSGKLLNNIQKYCIASDASGSLLLCLRTLGLLLESLVAIMPSDICV